LWAKLLLVSFIVSSRAIFSRVISQEPSDFKRGRPEPAPFTHRGFEMKAHTTAAALLGAVLLATGPALAQDRDVATVVQLFVEQAPGLLAEERLARGSRGPRWAEIKRTGTGDRTGTELVRIPPGVAVRAGDRLLVASRAEPSASAGAGAPSRVPMEPQLERPLDFTAQGIRAPAARPLAVVPGSCVPF
jgi:hypothetical protein